MIGKKRLWLGATIATVAALAVSLAVSAPANATSMVTITNVTSSSTTAGASGVTLTYTFTVNQAISAGMNVGFGTRISGYCPSGNCSHDMSGTALAGLSGTLNKQASRVDVNLSSQQGTGSVIVTISNAVNPTVAGVYTPYVDINGTQIESSVPLYVGALAVVGQVKMPDGSPASGSSGIGVNVQTQDFSFNYGTGVNNYGYFAIPVVTQNGTIASGTTYMLNAWPGNTSGAVAPDPISFVYSGVVQTKNITLVAASKTIAVTVRYDNGNPVSGANVWANKRGGGSNIGGTTNSSGVKNLLVAGGSWDVGVNCPWDPMTNQPSSCDWAYNQPPTGVDFAQDSTTETQSLTLTVLRAGSVIKGKVLKPDGTPLPGGFVNIQKDGAFGLGTGINNVNGTFTANVPAGSYRVNIFPDNMNPVLAKLYTSEISVQVGDSQTVDLGSITMKQKTSVITGKVMTEGGTGVANVRVNAWMQGTGGGWGNTTSGADGTFSLYVSPGEWQVMVDNGPSSGNYIGVDNRPQTASVSENQTVSGVNITVRLADATLIVKLVDGSGNAISNMFGYAYARKQSGGFGPGNEFGGGIDRGTATIRLIGGQIYTVGVNTPPDASIGFSMREEVSVAIALGETKVVKVTLVPNDSTIKGYVKDQSGRIITGVDAEVFVMDENWQWRGTRLQGDGSFSISVRGGRKYMAGVNFRGGSAGYVASHPKPGDDFLVPANTEYTKILTILKADSTISGVVKKPDGTPMSHAWVNANNFQSMENKLKGEATGANLVDTGTETRTDGTFSIAVVAGKYNLHAGMPGEFSGNYMPPQEVSVEVSPTKPASNVVLQFRQADATVVATVLLPDGTKPDMGFCHAWSEQGGFSGKEVFNGTANIPLTTGTWNIGCDSHNPKTNKFYRSDEVEITVAKGSNASRTFNLEEGLFNIPQGYTETFSATAQKSITLPDGTTITIPANALGTEGNVTFKADPDINLFHTKDTKPLNFAWNFEALNSSNQPITTFNSNVTVCIPYEDDYLEKVGVDESAIVAKFYNSTSGSWQLPEGVSQDFDQNRVCFSVSHFTNFALATGSQVGGTTGGPAYVLATPASAGGPQVTVLDASGRVKLSFFAFASTLRVGIKAYFGDIDGDGTNEIIVVTGAGAGPQVRIFNLSGRLIGQFFLFSSGLRVGVNLAVADVNGDGSDEIIATTMTGAGPQVRIFNGAGQVLSQFFAYASTFRGGVNLAAADVTGDGTAEIITAVASAGGPQVRVFNYQGRALAQFFAYASNVRGTFHLTTGDVNGDGTADIVVTPGRGLGPQVAMFTGSGELIRRFFAYATTFRGGLTVSVGDVNGDGSNEIVATPESGAGPQVRVFNTAGRVLSQFFAYSNRLRGSFSSVVADINQDGTQDIVTAPGAGMGPQVRVFNSTGGVIAQFFTHHTGFRGGLNISGIPVF